MKPSLLANPVTLTIVCARTGIAGTIDMPAVPGFALEFQHPIAYYPTALSIAQRKRDYLSKLEPSVLAGCIITILRHHKMLSQPAHQHSLWLNEKLCEAKRSVLYGTLYVLSRSVNHFEASKKLFATLQLTEDCTTNDLLRSFISSIQARLSTPVAYNDKDPYNNLSKLEAAELEATRKEVWEEAEAERERKATLRREAKAKKKASIKRFGVQHLEADVDLGGRSVLEYQLQNEGYGAVEDASSKLLRKLVKDGVTYGCLSNKQAVTLNTISYSLISVKAEDRKIVCDKLNSLANAFRNEQDSYAGALLENIAKLLAIFGEVEEDKLVEDMGGAIIENASVSAKQDSVTKPSTLLERIKAKRGTA